MESVSSGGGEQDGDRGCIADAGGRSSSGTEQNDDLVVPDAGDANSMDTYDNWAVEVEEPIPDYVMNVMEAVFGNDMLLEHILAKVVEDNNRPTVRNCRLVSKTWLCALAKLYRKMKKPQFLVNTSSDNTLPEPRPRPFFDQHTLLFEFIKPMTRSDRIEGFIPTFALRIGPSYFRKSNYADFVNCLVQCGASLVELYIKFPKNSAMSFLLPPGISLPNLCTFGISFSGQSLLGHQFPVPYHHQHDYFPNHCTIHLVQSILNTAKNLRCLQFMTCSNPVNPPDLENLYLPDSLQSIVIDTPLREFELLLRKNFQCLTHLRLSATIALYSEESIFELFSKLCSTLKYVTLTGAPQTRRSLPIRLPKMVNLVKFVIFKPWEFEERTPSTNFEDIFPSLKELVFANQTEYSFRYLMSGMRSTSLTTLTVWLTSLRAPQPLLNPFFNQFQDHMIQNLPVIQRLPLPPPHPQPDQANRRERRIRLVQQRIEQRLQQRDQERNREVRIYRDMGPGAPREFVRIMPDGAVAPPPLDEEARRVRRQQEELDRIRIHQIRAHYGQRIQEALGLIRGAPPHPPENPARRGDVDERNRDPEPRARAEALGLAPQVPRVLPFQPYGVAPNPQPPPPPRNLAEYQREFLRARERVVAVGRFENLNLRRLFLGVVGDENGGDVDVVNQRAGPPMPPPPRIRVDQMPPEENGDAGRENPIEQVLANADDPELEELLDVPDVRVEAGVIELVENNHADVDERAENQNGDGPAPAPPVEAVPVAAAELEGNVRENNGQQNGEAAEEQAGDRLYVERGVRRARAAARERRRGMAFAAARPFHQVLPQMNLPDRPVTMNQERMQSINIAFPNLAHLTVNICGPLTCGLKYIFGEMTSLKSLRIIVVPSLWKIKWDSVLTGISEEFCEAVKTSSDLWEEMYLNENQVSIKQMTKLERLTLMECIKEEVEQQSADESYISDVAFHFGLLKMKALKHLTVTPDFAPSKLMYKKWYEEKGYRIKTLPKQRLEATYYDQ